MIDAKLKKWIESQALFFVGTAPLAKKGHVNVSPKGPIDSLRVIDDRTVAYLDVIGSGAETIAHVRENGRIVVMLCAFAGPPRILRLHGRGEVVLPGSKRFDALMSEHRFADAGVPEARRAIVVVRCNRVKDSCGYGVPLMRFEGTRTQMSAWGERKLAKGGTQALTDYRRDHNETSIDGLPALTARASPSKRPSRRRDRT